jgi:ketosteroid isomerase-like protein
MPGSTKDEVEARNKAIVQASFDAWKAGTGGPFDLLSDDAMWTIVGNSLVAGTYAGREAFLAGVIRPFNARTRKDWRPSIRSLYADGDTVIIFFDARGTARDGRPYANTYAWFFEMREGRVVNAVAFFDSIAFNDLWQRVTPEQA